MISVFNLGMFPGGKFPPGNRKFPPGNFSKNVYSQDVLDKLLYVNQCKSQNLKLFTNSHSWKRQTMTSNLRWRQITDLGGSCSASAAPPCCIPAVYGHSLCVNEWNIPRARATTASWLSVILLSWGLSLLRHNFKQCMETWWYFLIVQVVSHLNHTIYHT